MCVCVNKDSAHALLHNLEKIKETSLHSKYPCVHSKPHPPKKQQLLPKLSCAQIPVIDGKKLGGSAHRRRLSGED